MIFEELSKFITSLQDILDRNLDAFSYWDQATTAKESYRKLIIQGISGTELPLSTSALASYLNACLIKLDTGIEKAWDQAGKIPSTYFTHAVTDHELIMVSDGQGGKSVKTNEKGLSCFKAKAFSLHHLPHFLEGPVHFLRCHPDADTALELVENIRHSDLYDENLKMYKVNACLDDEPMEIGRARVFSPGWFENESIWLHMEYKYMYEILRNGLNDFFFDTFKDVFIPFQKPEVYGRSILENSSFLVSSANPDKSLHGTGFVARLSGATAEFIQILLHMAMGPKPFKMDANGDLIFQMKPVLPSWLFTQEAQNIEVAGLNGDSLLSVPANSFSFMLLGEILVTYHNPAMKNTWGPHGVSPIRWNILDGEGNAHQIEGDRIVGDMAGLIRDRRIEKIEVTLG